MPSWIEKLCWMKEEMMCECYGWGRGKLMCWRGSECKQGFEINCQCKEFCGCAEAGRGRCVIFSCFIWNADHLLRIQKMGKKRERGMVFGEARVAASSVKNSFCIAWLKWEICKEQRGRWCSERWGEKMDSFENRAPTEEPEHLTR